MTKPNERVLTINGGSSSIKFAMYDVGQPLQRLLSGHLDRIGSTGTTLTVSEPHSPQPSTCPVDAADTDAATAFLIDWLEKQPVFDGVRAIGHRVVQGMDHTEPERITPGLLTDLRRISEYDPDHLPGEIKLIEAFQTRHPAIPQFACFDTAFHRTMPRMAQLLPIPRRFDAKGVRRYGFHGLSYSYLLEELSRVADAETVPGRVILAHLGSGASLAAVRDGKSVDTSMGVHPGWRFGHGNPTRRPRSGRGLVPDAIGAVDPAAIQSAHQP